MLAQCVGSDTKADTAIAGYAGDAACASCHQDLFQSHRQTAHHLTSMPASDKNVLGSFLADSNTFQYPSGHQVRMEIRDGKPFQVAYLKGKEQEVRRMDIVIGSGAKGQSFLAWNRRSLYQLPITYFSAAHTWSNSPGFPPFPDFGRVITSRCMECHSGYAQVVTAPGVEPEKFDRSKILYGVGCERCHGPAAEHVAFHQQNPEAKTAQHIINTAHLSRQQSLDACALCHGGRLQKTTASFSFVAGGRLGDHFVVDSTPPDPQTIDVHGNQYGLMRASKCFIKSNTLTCNSCHNSHQNERGNTLLFSQRCMSCHQPQSAQFCTFTGMPKAQLKANCIDCHMPLQSSKAIAVFLPGKTTATAASIRSHWVSLPKQTVFRNAPNRF
ncbi:hypothetical protein BUE76_21700 [Cnuella takakiae]|nr:hypothetical protein BUE76_21700 [Cnuella takakiae]